MVPVRILSVAARQNVILSNPASDLELPRREKRLPKHVMTVSEVERVLSLPHMAIRCVCGTVPSSKLCTRRG